MRRTRPTDFSHSSPRRRWRAPRTALVTMAAVFAGTLVSDAAGQPKTSLVSGNAAGTGSGNGPSAALSVSANGRFAWFQSRASDLVTTDTNGAFDVFLRDLRRGTTTLVSVDAAGTDSGNGDSLVAALSPNGRFMLFSSEASDLVATDTNGLRDVFLRDLKSRKDDARLSQCREHGLRRRHLRRRGDERERTVRRVPERCGRRRHGARRTPHRTSMCAT